MSTNGHLVERKSAVLKFVDKLKISIDGPRELHDSGRGPGAFDLALAGARHASNAGVSVALRMTLTRHNLQGVGTTIELAKELGVGALFQPAIGDLMDAGAGLTDYSANREQYRAVIDELILLKAQRQPIANEVLCLQHLKHWPEPKPMPFCSGGRIEAAIGPNGCMYPCGRVGRALPAPNAFELGVAEAFRLVQRPMDCENCWCTLTLAGCYLYRGDLRLLM